MIPEDLKILLLVFGVPAVPAFYIKWGLSALVGHLFVRAPRVTIERVSLTGALEFLVPVCALTAVIRAPDSVCAGLITWFVSGECSLFVVWTVLQFCMHRMLVPHRYGYGSSAPDAAMRGLYALGFAPIYPGLVVLWCFLLGLLGKRFLGPL
ncbi:MAG: hypothetical protein AB1646_08475 [Thermodesulfobacteriota bacterium]